MIQIVINFDVGSSVYKVYEPTTDTVLVSDNLTEALVNLGLFLMSANLISGNLIEHTDITYHLDSHTMKAMVESNVNLVKKLQSGPSEFMKSSQRFGGSSGPMKSKNESRNNFKGTDRKFSSKNTSTFSGKSGFKTASKKFGSK